ncbi:MAG: efflux RND transporter periplasmic adaptor subunit [Deltaproteobacteria bacterium]
MKRRKGLLLITLLILLAVIAFPLYRYGYKIPILKEIPFFSGGHEHVYRPVLDDEGEIEYWTCAMHPTVRLKEPGQCPICGMDTTPVLKKDNSQAEPASQTKMEEKDSTGNGEDMSGTQGHDHSKMGVPAKKDKGGESKSTFTVSSERQQIIGVKTQPAEIRQMDKTIRTVGIVKLDETKIEHIHIKFSGWIERVFADYTWQHVKAGDPLFSIYSPELVSTQEEYLLALRSNEILSNSEFPEISGGAKSLLGATRRRLRLWDISESQIREIAQTRRVKDSLVIYSPVTGHIVEKNAFENMFVEPNTTLYTIADHSSAWVEVDIYENEIPLVKLGDNAVMTLASYPGEKFEGKITFITPHLDMKTRTIKVRLEFPNPDLILLPQMYGDVTLEVPLGDKLTIPVSAVLRTGKQDIVFVDKGDGDIEIRKVEIGRKAEGYYEVLRGLAEGDRVVSRANFLIDSESKIQAAVASWGENNDGDDTDSTTPSEHQEGSGKNPDAQ